mmetsp:Transcript_17017/g.23383  ORF Transcript_17017/g.23383 Transcript_17017/m.23383 type:complete len:189 (+) Transcript_17017:88-654(+)
MKFVAILLAGLVLTANAFVARMDGGRNQKIMMKMSAKDLQYSRRDFVNAISVSAALVAAPVLYQARPAFAEDEFIQTDSGLKYLIVKEGTGGNVTPGQTIKAHYTGWLDDFDSEKKFDSSYDRRKPLVFQVGTGRVIKGWDEALLSMKIGEKRRIIVPANLGYGSRGAGGVIPPGATLYFDVELLGLQ